ncbi:uncharacterized protein LOC105190852 [Harpegnathos saltator]|nr:uncharacterized protein LOC105190852 [Harpegnathos saltator]XP_025156185.1 uncharacterized protein LOC105190852 [Harpegnathos saltator]
MSDISMVNSIITKRDRECFACRMISGCGLFGSGLYVYHHTKKYQNPAGQAAMYAISSVLVLLGTARILDIPPFQDRFKRKE